MSEQYYLLKEIAPADDAHRYMVATFDGSTKTFKVLFWDDTEDKARATHHRMLFGHDE